jgi:hypothetical protein
MQPNITADAKSIPAQMSPRSPSDALPRPMMQYDGNGFRFARAAVW